MDNNRIISQCIVLLILYRSLPVDCAPTEKPPKYGMYNLMFLNFEDDIAELLVQNINFSV